MKKVSSFYRSLYTLAKILWISLFSISLVFIASLVIFLIGYIQLSTSLSTLDNTFVQSLSLIIIFTIPFAAVIAIIYNLWQM